MSKIVNPLKQLNAEIKELDEAKPFYDKCISLNDLEGDITIDLAEVIELIAANLIGKLLKDGAATDGINVRDVTDNTASINISYAMPKLDDVSAYAVLEVGLTPAFAFGREKTIVSTTTIGARYDATGTIN